MTGSTITSALWSRDLSETAREEMTYRRIHAAPRELSSIA
jgi:hypothetical protein